MTITQPFTAIPTAIRTRFKTLIEDGGDGGDAVLSIYPNDNRIEPDTGVWARVTIREGTRDQQDFGASAVRSRTPGVLFVEVFTDVSTGTSAIEAIAQRVLTAFQRVTAADVNYRTPYLAGGSSGARIGKWWRLSVACPFYADDIS